jgi:hypothetical protein
MDDAAGGGDSRGGSVDAGGGGGGGVADGGEGLMVMVGGVVSGWGRGRSCLGREWEHGWLVGGWGVEGADWGRGKVGKGWCLCIPPTAALKRPQN